MTTKDEGTGKTEGAITIGVEEKEETTDLTNRNTVIDDLGKTIRRREEDLDARLRIS